MKGWREVKVGNIAEKIAMGPFGANIKVETFVKQGVPIISGMHLKGLFLLDEEFKFISHEHAERLKNSIVYPEDVIFTHAGNVGQVSMIPKNCNYPYYIISQRQFFMRCDKNYALPEYITYYFHSKKGQNQLLANVNSTGVPSIVQPSSYLKSIVISLPPLPEQRAIASVLSNLDDKIDLLHRQNATLERMAETLFRQWFVVEAKEEWEDARVSDVAFLNQRTKLKNYSYTEIQYLDTGSITEGKIDKLQSFFTDEAPSRAQRLVEHSDILISMVRPNQKHYGIIQNPPDNLVVSTGFTVLSCHKISPFFLYLFLTSNDMTEFLSSVAEGSTSAYPSLKPSDIADLTFKLPPKEKLLRFDEYAQCTWRKIYHNQTQIRTLEKLRDTLLPKLMSGEVRVSC